MNEINLVLIIAIIGIVFVSGCASQQTGNTSSPEGAVKKFLDNVIKGDYEVAFQDVVDRNGQPIPQQKERMIEAIKKLPISNYEILGTSIVDINEVSVIKQIKPRNITVVLLKITDKNTGQTQETKQPVLEVNGVWKFWTPY